MSQYSQFGADDTRTAQEKRDYFINQFPQEFAKFKEAHPELSKLSFINRLKVIVFNNDVNIEEINFFSKIFR